MSTDRAELVALIPQLASNGPRYTSYPTANLFVENDFSGDYGLAWNERPSGRAQDISVYIHVPFCATVCFYCACNKVHTANRAHTETYLEHLQQEIALQARVTGRRRITQLHFGGGTPTSFSPRQMAQVFETLAAHYELDDSDQRDFSIELDPRKVTTDEVQALAGLGFNRISVGIQDFDPRVQLAVNRTQSQLETQLVIDAARGAGVKSVSVDLIYGLPRQTTERFARTLQEVVRLDPDRISLYSYAHLPELFKTQRQINAEELPTPQTKLALLSLGIEAFEAAGYEYLGMDHFAKRSDSLCRARRDGTLQRNFMGYSTHADCPLLALGVSAIGQCGALYTQNHKTLKDYFAAVDAGRLPLAKGLLTNADDRIRRSLIQDLMCRLQIDLQAFEAQTGRPLERYFAQSWTAVEELEAFGLLQLTTTHLKVTSLGRYFLRNICMRFDAYLGQGEARFSKTV